MPDRRHRPPDGVQDIQKPWGAAIDRLLNLAETGLRPPVPHLWAHVALSFGEVKRQMSTRRPIARLLLRE
jgi:hypothetical protein